MNRSASIKLLAGACGFVVVVGVYLLAIITMYSLDRGNWSTTSIFLMFILTIATIIGLAFLSSVFGEYSYSKGWREGNVAAQMEMKTESDNASNENL